MMPKRSPVANPVSEFVLALLEDVTHNAPEAELLHTIAVNGANSDPNGVIDMLVGLHEKIGVFIVAMNDGEFREWTAPEPDAAELGLDVPDPDMAEAVLELP